MSPVELISTAFVMGAAGSLHCLGMCGPLALSLPLPGQSMQARVQGGLLYNAGRIITYSVLGLVLSSVGAMLLRPGWQQGISIAAGLLLIGCLFGGMRRLERAGSAVTPFLALRGVLGRLFQRYHYGSVFAIGLLNGLLPCGTVYLALLTSFLAGSALKGALFLAVFGLGTLPAMLLMILWGAALRPAFRERFRRAAPLLLGLMGVLLVLRGLGLGIPYLSPGTVLPATGEAVLCH